MAICRQENKKDVESMEIMEIMDYVYKYLPGVVLAIFHVGFLWAILSNLKRLICCTKKVDATVKSVSEHEHKHKDSDSGKITYSYTYKVIFEYDFNGKHYESIHEYSKHAHYSKGNKTYIKINPLKPSESWTKHEFKDLFVLSLAIPVLAFFDYVYIMAAFM